jgi:hypothetical protein
MPDADTPAAHAYTLGDRLRWTATMISALAVLAAIVILSGMLSTPSKYAEAHATDSYRNQCPYLSMHRAGSSGEFLICAGHTVPSEGE